MTARNPKFTFGICSLLLLVGLLFTKEARADEQLIIKHPGDHPVYSVEMEPHLAFAAFLPHAGGYGVGLGGRFSIPIVRNGFVSSINNSVAIGLGLDWIHYDGCIHDVLFSDNCSNLNTFVLPVVLQWNFFLSTHWSVFAEPGLDLYFRSYRGTCIARDQRGVPYGPIARGPWTSTLSSSSWAAVTTSRKPSRSRCVSDTRTSPWASLSCHDGPNRPKDPAWRHGPSAAKLSFIPMMLAYAAYVLVGILGLALLMVVHEGGHYLAARAFKMRVVNFSIGFGPAIFRHKPEGSATTYQVAIIPFLAYVQIAGMNPLEEVDPNDKGSYANASLIGRITTIFAGPLANYLFASVLFFASLLFGGKEVLNPASTEVNVVPTARPPSRRSRTATGSSRSRAPRSPSGTRCASSSPRTRARRSTSGVARRRDHASARAPGTHR